MGRKFVDTVLGCEILFINLGETGEDINYNDACAKRLLKKRA